MFQLSWGGSAIGYWGIPSLPFQGVGLDAVKKRDKFLGARGEAMVPNESTVIAARGQDSAASQRCSELGVEAEEKRFKKEQSLDSIF